MAISVTHALRPLRVLHVIPSVSPQDGGPSRAVALMEHSLDAAGVKVTTLTTDHGCSSSANSTPNILSRGRSAQRIYVHKWIDAYKFAPNAVPRLVRAINCTDVVHVHALFSFTSTAAAWIARAARVPYVIRPLGTLSAYGLSVRRRLKRLSMALIETEILRHAAAVHFTSQAELHEAQTLGLAFRGVVIPLGVELEQLSSSFEIDNPFAATGKRVILFLSRLDPKKNIESLIDAVAGSEKLRRTSTLLIAGTGEGAYVSSLRARADGAGISDAIVWLGHVEGPKKAAALAAADVFVLPSYSENFGIAAAEAMLSGLPSVLGEGVAIARDAHEAGAGLIVRPVSSDIANALEYLLTNDILRRSMALQAKVFAERRYSTRAMAEKLVELYEEIRTVGRTAH